MALKQDLTNIANYKEEKKKQLKKIKNIYIKLIYAGLSKRKSIKEIHKALYNATINKKSPMLVKAMKLTSVIKKKVDNKKDTKYILSGFDGISPVIAFSILVFDEIKKVNVDQELTHEINVEEDKRESEKKLEALEDAMASDNVFFLASKHGDCAKDHLIAQGRLFYNENWLSVIKSEIARIEIQNFIDKRKLETVQYITDAPVYFITRPNCRHYFKEIPVKEAIQTPVSNLLHRYKMETAIGRRNYLQTLRSGKSRKILGELRNAELVIEKYKDRLQLFKAMYEEQPNPVIRNAIIKTQTLIQKWEVYYEKLAKKE